MSAADNLADRLGRLVYDLRSASADVTALVELAEGEEVHDALRLLWAEVRVARRRAENISKFLTHPARRGGAE